MKHKMAVGIAVLSSVFFACVLIRAPLSLASPFLPAGIKLAGCEGSLWQGRASALGVGGQIVQEDIRWHFLPSHLWQGHLAWEIQGKFNKENSQLTLKLGPTRIIADELRVVVPANPLFSQHDKLKGLKLGGLLHLQSTHLGSDQPGTLNGQLVNLFSALVPDQGALGSYRLALTLQPGLNGTWNIAPQQGVLGINGNGSLNLMQGHASGSLAFTPQGQALANLQPILAMLPKQGDAYTLQFAAR